MCFALNLKTLKHQTNNNRDRHTAGKTIVISFFTNQIFHYTRCNTLKRVTSLRGPSPRHCARVTQLPFEEMLQRRQAVGNNVSDLTSPRF